MATDVVQVKVKMEVADDPPDSNIGVSTADASAPVPNQCFITSRATRVRQLLRKFLTTELQQMMHSWLKRTTLVVFCCDATPEYEKLRLTAKARLMVRSQKIRPRLTKIHAATRYDSWPS